MIWKITKSGEATVWLQEPLLDATSPDGFGANDIEFDRDVMFVSNLQQGSVVRIKMPERVGDRTLKCLCRIPR